MNWRYHIHGSEVSEMSGSEVVMDKSLGVIADSGPGAHVVPHLRHLSERHLHHHVIWYMLYFEGI